MGKFFDKALGQDGDEAIQKPGGKEGILPPTFKHLLCRKGCGDGHPGPSGLKPLPASSIAAALGAQISSP